LVCGCLYSGYWLGDKSLLRHQQLVDTQGERLAELYQHSDKLQQKINFLNVEIEIEKQAATHVQQQLAELHQKNFKLQSDLSFYQKIMAPELGVQGLAVDSVIISPTNAERVFHYKVVLVQTQKQKRYARGYIEVKIKGSQANVAKTLDIKTVVAGLDKKGLKFSFQYFKIFEGDMILPQGFNAQSVVVSAILPSSKWQKYQRLDRQYPFESKVD
jgi:hypothetical protein